MKNIKMLKLLKMLKQRKNGYTDCFEFQAAVCSTEVAWNGQRCEDLKLVLGILRRPLSQERR